MESQKFMTGPILVTAVVSAIVFGNLGYSFRKPTESTTVDTNSPSTTTQSLPVTGQFGQPIDIGNNVNVTVHKDVTDNTQLNNTSTSVSHLVDGYKFINLHMTIENKGNSTLSILELLDNFGVRDLAGNSYRVSPDAGITSENRADNLKEDGLQTNKTGNYLIGFQVPKVFKLDSAIYTDSNVTVEIH